MAPDSISANIQPCFVKPYLYVQKYWILNTETHKISQHAFWDQQVTNGYEL